jgi:hypothetical protein
MSRINLNFKPKANTTLLFQIIKENILLLKTQAIRSELSAPLPMLNDVFALIFTLIDSNNISRIKSFEGLNLTSEFQT